MDWMPDVNLHWLALINQWIIIGLLIHVIVMLWTIEGKGRRRPKK